MDAQQHGVKNHYKENIIVVGGTCDKNEGKSFGKILEDPRHMTECYV